MYQLFLNAKIFKYVSALTLVVAVAIVLALNITSDDAKAIALKADEMALVLGGGACNDCEYQDDHGSSGYWDCETGQGCNTGIQCLGHPMATFIYRYRYGTWDCTGEERGIGETQCQEIIRWNWSSHFENKCFCNGAVCEAEYRIWYGYDHCRYTVYTCPL